MYQRQIITDLLGLQGWEVVDNGVEMEGESVVVSIRRRPGSGYGCRGWGQMFLFCHDHLETRRVRDFPVWGGDAIWNLPRPGSNAPGVACW